MERFPRSCGVGIGGLIFHWTNEASWTQENSDWIGKAEMYDRWIYQYRAVLFWRTWEWLDPRSFIFALRRWLNPFIESRLNAFKSLKVRSPQIVVTIPNLCSNVSSFSRSQSIRWAGPAGLFFPASHASTVFTDTPKAPAKLFWERFNRNRSRFIDSPSYSRSGWIVTVCERPFDVLLRFSYRIASVKPVTTLSNTVLFFISSSMNKTA